MLIANIYGVVVIHGYNIAPEILIKPIALPRIAFSHCGEMLHSYRGAVYTVDVCRPISSLKLYHI